MQLTQAAYLLLSLSATSLAAPGAVTTYVVPRSLYDELQSVGYLDRRSTINVVPETRSFADDEPHLAKRWGISIGASSDKSKGVGITPWLCAKLGDGASMTCGMMKPYCQVVDADSPGNRRLIPADPDVSDCGIKNGVCAKWDLFCKDKPDYKPSDDVPNAPVMG
ncbi:hypothetical protein MGG_09128 [Pyricularia oryzae 70-15]|uniref:Uncharacterized protein n=3 Tax=Pyricularia oryzae TaxID=318829 RepID=Q2KEV6_PYRO7|nr:uncharacterized protein MGG_09128 [Pyricularia oryzae 70-15]ELQ38481.1 hypothetical protein OOU_Y34scaffold00539g5 [Pyricularia oryzae Y34]KAI7913815.1 hypothetical protein M9X92_009274 [Pyricularia oryzae]EAQ71523.1 hypothetical protein MGCH7_ch7g930 [Pyricularia oryzae 70-15]KAI7914299.1 hypothetical protein M0657_009545 [Pyricularia oryzae]KYQ30469.1 hypothetical protein MGG_09128 [Pyricularia oryzae 70-15]